MSNQINISPIPFCIIGLFCGGLLAYTPHYPEVTAKLIVDVWYYWVGFFGITFLLAYQSKQTVFCLLCTSIIASFLSALPFAWQSTLHGSLSTFILCVVNAYAINAFHLNYSRNQFYFSDHTLFDAVWNTGLQLFIALCFTLLCHLIIDAWGSLFEFIGVTFFQKLFKTAKFTIWSISFFFAIGLWIVIRAVHIIQQCRLIFLMICRYLFPPLAIIGILFIMSALISLSVSHQTIALTSNKNYFFLYFSFFSVIFFNAIYQDNVVTNPYPLILTWIIRIFLWLVPIFAILPLYAVFQEKITSENFAYTVNALLLLIYNISYAFISFHHIPRAQSIQKINILFGLIVIITALTTTSPWVYKKLPKSAPFYPKITTQIN